MLLCENVSTLLTPDVVRGRKEGCKEIFLTTGRGSYDTGGRMFMRAFRMHVSFSVHLSKEADGKEWRNRGGFGGSRSRGGGKG